MNNSNQFSTEALMRHNTFHPVDFDNKDIRLHTCNLFLFYLLLCSGDVVPGGRDGRSAGVTTTTFRLFFFFLKQQQQQFNVFESTGSSRSDRRHRLGRRIEARAPLQKRQGCGSGRLHLSGSEWARKGGSRYGTLRYNPFITGTT